MVAPFYQLIGTAGHQNHHEDSHRRIRSMAGERFEQLRHPERHCLHAVQRCEPDSDQEPDSASYQSLPTRGCVRPQLGMLFLPQFHRNPLFILPASKIPPRLVVKAKGSMSQHHPARQEYRRESGATSSCSSQANERDPG